MPSLLPLPPETPSPAWQRESLQFAALASSVLASSLDFETTVQSVARLAISFVAEWCAVDVLEGGALRRCAVARREEAGLCCLSEWDKLQERDTQALAEPVARLARARLIGGLDNASPEEADALARHGFSSFMALPLTVHGEVLGTLSLASCGGRGYERPHLAFAEDLAHRAALALNAARLYQEAQAADRRKDEFLAMLAHELRNPLAPILTTLETLKIRFGDEEELHRPLGVIERQARLMARLVDDLLDLCRMTQGKIRLHQREVDLTCALAQAADTCRPLLASRSHVLRLSLPEGPLPVSGDLARLEQVFTNLLSNAAKYTPPEGHIDLSLEREGLWAVARVKDDGIGIPPEMTERIFELFVQVNPHQDRAHGGLGLGLTLVQTLVGLHGGQVTAHSEGAGKGSEFTVRLPLSGESAPAPEEASVGRRPRAVQPSLHILIGEDNVDARESLTDLLELWGHRVCVAADGHAALEWAVRERFDLALVDLGLPGMTGFEVASAIRAHEQSAKLPRLFLVALTGYGQPADAQKALQCGFDAHRTKPIDGEELHALLARRGRGS